MATKRPTGSRSEVVRCPNCGEDYSVTYKRCPFCDEKNLPPEDDYDEDEESIEGEEDDRPAHRVGRRVAGQRRGGGYGEGFGVLRILVTVASLALIVAAVWIVFSVIAPMVGRSEIEPPPSELPSASPVVTPSADPAEPTAPVNSGLPAITPPPVTTPPVSSVTPTGNLKLSREDFSMFKAGEVYSFTATGAFGAVTYQSDKPDVATVDAATGKVTAVSKGIANITATDASGVTAKCIVRCNLPAGGASPSAQPSASVSGNAKLSREDFTLTEAGQKYTIKVTGATGTPVWSVGDSGVASVSGSGAVTAVGKGMTTVTCTVDGQTLKCIVRCTWS